jgi:hypothetical protein
MLYGVSVMYVRYGKGYVFSLASLVKTGRITLRAKNPFSLMGLFGLPQIALAITYSVSDLGSNFRSIRVLFRLICTPVSGVYGVRTYAVLTVGIQPASETVSC